jgi:AcrR family transcriptional regulator
MLASKTETCSTFFMNARAQRIVATAIELAEKGGFEAVRLRDVAAEADVALGTLYRYFRSKEDLLIAALNSEVEDLESLMSGRLPSSPDPLQRVCDFFRGATKGLTRRPRLSRAILRAAASGDRELAEKVAMFHTRMSAMIKVALHGQDDTNAIDAIDEATAEKVAWVLECVWFAALVGWAGGLLDQDEVIEQMNNAAALVLRERSQDSV